MINNMMNITKSILAMVAAIPAITPKPRTAATIAITRKSIAVPSWPVLFILY